MTLILRLTNMLGSEFANKVAEYVASTGEKPPSGLGVIPSLFYNINTSSVEDFTGRGASFGFILYEELQKAAAYDEVKAALAAKISKERIETEIDLTVSGNQPVKAMTYICDLTLFWIVVNLPPKSEPAVSDRCDRLCIAYLDAAWNLT
ncbi:hypothetical protein Pint_07711 [Pistacia integerrima]|uniref:Uncharacterized protein n=1 Tax=Pistacia integerrima TaxID=434235 RepID=A0ACC0XVD4_9ROSI|nr:hypothetical protein Pint_07711 [Pistacia integerrima]